MRITLSTHELPELVEKGATYEPFLPIQHTHTHTLIFTGLLLVTNHQLAGSSLNLPKYEHENEKKRGRVWYQWTRLSNAVRFHREPLFWTLASFR
jgi:hypothetical protein